MLENAEVMDEYNFMCVWIGVVVIGMSSEGGQAKCYCSSHVQR